MIKLVTLAQALAVTAGLALAPTVAFAQTAPTSPTAPAAPKVAKPAEVKTPLQTAEAACAVHKKDSKEHKECVDKHKPSVTKTIAKEPAKKS